MGKSQQRLLAFRCVCNFFDMLVHSNTLDGRRHAQVRFSALYRRANDARFHSGKFATECLLVQAERAAGRSLRYELQYVLRLMPDP